MTTGKDGQVNVTKTALKSEIEQRKKTTLADAQQPKVTKAEKAKVAKTQSTSET